MPAIPAEVRINVNSPFPALVNGQNGISLGKQNGIWTVALNTPSLMTVIPPTAAYATDFVIVYDSVAQTYFKMPLNSISGMSSGSRKQRSVTTSPITIAVDDQILNVNISSGSPTCTLPTAASRTGVALIFVDVGAQFAAHPLTITPVGGETISGLASVTLSTNRQFVTLTPFNDTVNTGWVITG